MRDVFSALPAVAGAAPQPAVLSFFDTFLFTFVRLLVGSDDRLVFLAFFIELRFAFRAMYKECKWLYDRGMGSINIMAYSRPIYSSKPVLRKQCILFFHY